MSTTTQAQRELARLERKLRQVSRFNPSQIGPVSKDVAEQADIVAAERDAGGA